MNWMHWVVRAMSACGLAMAMAGPLWAQGEQEGLREVQLAADAFTRGTPLPNGIQLAQPLDDADEKSRAVVVQVADTHLMVAPQPAWVVNRVVRANHSNALAQLGQVLLAFNPSYQKLRLHRLAVRRNGKDIDHTQSVPVKFLQRESQLEQGVYKGEISVSLLVPDLRVGDALHLVYGVEGSNPILGPVYADGAGWEEVSPVQWRRVTLHAPEGRSIRWRWQGGRDAQPGPQPKRQVEGGMVRLVFEQKDLAAVDVENDLPPEAFPLRWLQFSEFSDWQQVAHWAAELFRNDATLPAALEPELAAWRQEANESLRASLALQWVQNNIRYHSVLLGESSHRPHTPAEVLQNRYGDCKDKSLLLIGMLRAAGLQADPVLVSLRRRRGLTGLLPTPNAFDHAVVRVVVAGQVHYLDPTRRGQVGPLERMGQHLEDAEVLLARPDATGLDIVRSGLRGQTFRSELTERFVLQSLDGAATLDSTWVFNGLGAEAFRAQLPHMSPEQKRQWALRGLDRRYPGLTVEADPVFVDDPTLNRLRVQIRYRVPKAVHKFKDEWALRFTTENMRGSFLVPERLTRELPVPVPAYPGSFQYQIAVQWPDEVGAVEDPRTRSLDSRFFKLQVDSSFRGREARRTVQFEPLVSQVSAEQLPRLIEDLDRMGQMVEGVLVVGERQIKRKGILGLGKQSVVDKMHEQLRDVIKGTTRALEQSGLQGSDRIDALCTRATSYADLGEAEKGLADAQAAVKLGPRSVEAAWCHASVRFVAGDFAGAAADFSRALALGHNAQEAHYRRGIAWYYRGDLERASEDFGKALQASGDDASKHYIRLWHAWTLLQLRQPLSASLVDGGGPDAEWPLPALGMMAGRLSPEELIRVLDRKEGDDRELALVEAWFYVGQWHKANGRPDLARQAFEQVVARNVTPYIEHAGAAFELRASGIAR